MKRSQRLTWLILFLLTTVMFASEVKVTFLANMAVQMKQGKFNPGMNSLYVVGDFQIDAGGKENWKPGQCKLLPQSMSDSIYQVSISLPAVARGTSYLYKFVIDGATWESADNRSFVLAAKDTSLSLSYFNNDSINSPLKLVKVTATFIADISPITGTGNGFFDDAKDSLYIAGMGDWDAKAIILSGNRRLHQLDPKFTGVYTTTLVIQGHAGDSARFKFQAFPDVHFTNSGWETGTNRYFIFPAGDSVYTLPTIQPRIGANRLLTKDIVVNFSVKLPEGSANARTGELIPRGAVQWVAVKGDRAELGNWGGNWLPTDTLTAPGTFGPTLIKLNDDGLDGDSQPGDGIWSKNIIFKSGSPAGYIAYRFACMYPGADTVQNRLQPLDNYSLAGCVAPGFMLEEPASGNTIRLFNTWGFYAGISKPGSLEPAKENSFALTQNFPNPFNPTTVISYMVGKSSMVTLRVYTLLGREVATLVHETKPAGSYSVTFSGTGLASGLYFYSLQAGSFSEIRKMLLLK
jgi:hypothetical protein